MGTANVLDAVRVHGGDVRAIVNVTSDKCYENREWEWGYREDEPMGGHDPYSSSKGCAELVTEAFRRSFFADGRRHAAGLGAGGKRDRRRGLGRRPARAGHHAGGAGGRRGARAQPQLDPPVAARAQPAQRVPRAGPGAVGLGRACGGMELRARRGGRPPGWLDRRAYGRAVAGGAPLDRRRRPPSSRGALPQARLFACAFTPGLAATGQARLGTPEHRRVVSRAERGSGHARGHARADRALQRAVDSTASRQHTP